MTKSLAVIACLTSSLVLAQTVPGTITFNARLTDTGGTPVTGSHGLGFGLYDTSSGGAALWTETVAGASFSTEGLAFVELGAVTALTPAALDGRKLYLEISVDGTTMTPRLAIVSVPYAIRASVAASALQVGSLTESAIQRRVTGTCNAGQAVRSIDAAGGVQCEALVSSGGDITEVTTAAGSGLQGGATSGAVALGLATCANGEVLRSTGTAWACASSVGAAASATTNGYLSSADWTSFNNRRDTGGANLINWSPVVSNWTFDTGTAATITLNTTDVLEGSSSFEFFVGSGTTGAQYNYGAMVPVDSRRPYLGRLSAKYASGGGTFSAGIEAYGAAGTSLGTRYFIATNIDLPLTTGWQNFGAVIQGEGTAITQFPVGTRFIRPRIFLNSGNIGGTRIDAFDFTETDQPAAVFSYSNEDGQDYTNTGWTNLTYAAFTGTKVWPYTRLKITWTDSFRTIAPGGSSGVCGWQLFVNGLSCNPIPLLQMQHDTNSAPSADNHRNVTLTQICTGIPAGPLALQVAGRRRGGNEDCYRGYFGGVINGNPYPSSIIIEEIQ